MSMNSHCIVSFRIDSVDKHPPFYHSAWCVRGFLASGQPMFVDIKNALPHPKVGQYVSVYNDGRIRITNEENFGSFAFGNGPQRLEEIPMPEIPAYQQRVIEEKVALDEKITKLSGFIHSSPSQFDSLGEDDQALMYAQLEVMTEYSRLLRRRIARFQTNLQ